MAKALKEVKNKIGKVDLVVEVRDARVPLVSGNPSLETVIGEKPHLIVLNKMDLADQDICDKWRTWFADHRQKAIFVNALQPASIKKIKNSCRDIVQDRWLKFAKKGIKPPPLRLIVVGIPNTGKSTIINRLANRNAAKTGDRPGITRNQEWIVIGMEMELLDTPGIMPPRIETEEHGLWLCSIHAIKDEIIGRERVAVYVVNQLKAIKSAEFVKRYRLDCLDHNEQELLVHIGERFNYKKHKGEIDLLKTCNQVLQDFRKGLLGPCSFETPPLEI
jgi:ribosome biogenesis GTPase A